MSCSANRGTQPVSQHRCVGDKGIAKRLSTDTTHAPFQNTRLLVSRGKLWRRSYRCCVPNLDSVPAAVSAHHTAHGTHSTQRAGACVSCTALAASPHWHWLATVCLQLPAVAGTQGFPTVTSMLAYSRPPVPVLSLRGQPSSMSSLTKSRYCNSSRAGDRSRVGRVARTTPTTARCCLPSQQQRSL